MRHAIHAGLGCVLLTLCTGATCAPDDSGLFGGGSEDASSAGARSIDAADSGWPDAAAGGATTDAGGDSTSDCVLTSWCRDADGDGWGALGELIESCDAPGADWIAAEPGQCTDCFDQSALVYPGSTHCLTQGYVAADAEKELPSFDADCDGVESECGAKAAAECGGTAGLCSGTGYLPEGPGSNPYCGSTAHRTCSGLGCTGNVAEKPPLGCR